MSRLEEADIATSSHSEWNGTFINGHSEDPALPNREEAPSIELGQEASQIDKGNGRMSAEQCDDRAESIRDVSDSYFNLEEHKMIDSGMTQI